MSDFEVTKIEIAKLDIQPGDLLLVRCPKETSPEGLVLIGDYVHRALREAGKLAQCLVSTSDIDYAIVRRVDHTELN